MSNLAIQHNAPNGMAPVDAIVPPGLERDYQLVRSLPLFEGIPNQDLVAAMTQGGIAQRHLERDMFVLDPIGQCRVDVCTRYAATGSPPSGRDRAAEVR